jgi:hypothetical protein
VASDDKMKKQPMDVNAGMDIVAVRQEYQELKFIGGYNKLEISNYNYE